MNRNAVISCIGALGLVFTAVCSGTTILRQTLPGSLEQDPVIPGFVEQLVEEQRVFRETFPGSDVVNPTGSGFILALDGDWFVMLATLPGIPIQDMTRPPLGAFIKQGNVLFPTFSNSKERDPNRPSLLIERY